MKITLGLVDDHDLFVSSLPLLIQTFSNMEVIVSATSGADLLQQLAVLPTLPNIILVDVKMKEMKGPDVANRIQERYPLIKLIALTMEDSEISVIRMLRAGCCAYLLKDIKDAELERAINEVHQTGFYNGDSSNIHYRRLLLQKGTKPGIQLSAKEETFLQLACSDLTYKQIASEMSLSERTIDGYRESLFEKFNVQSRVGMALEAIRLEFVKL